MENDEKDANIDPYPRLYKWAQGQTDIYIHTNKKKKKERTLYPAAMSYSEMSVMMLKRQSQKINSAAMQGMDTGG